MGGRHAGHGERLARRLVADVEHAVIVERHQRHAFFLGHRGVARDPHETGPVRGLAGEAIGDRDRLVTARLEALDDTAGELGIRDPALHAIITVVGLRIVKPVEAAEVRLEQHRRARRAPRHHRLA
ncbi:MAG: hypothetical protein IPQ07_25455 [Myxococcales bacterium]|nr:hypothetical protein [Myxococcales bacterium]